MSDSIRWHKSNRLRDPASIRSDMGGLQEWVDTLDVPRGAVAQGSDGVTAGQQMLRMLFDERQQLLFFRPARPRLPPSLRAFGNAPLRCVKAVPRHKEIPPEVRSSIKDLPEAASRAGPSSPSTPPARGSRCRSDASAASMQQKPSPCPMLDRGHNAAARQQGQN